MYNRQQKMIFALKNMKTSFEHKESNNVNQFYQKAHALNDQSSLLSEVNEFCSFYPSENYGYYAVICIFIYV